MATQSTPALASASVLDIEQLVAALPTTSRERFERLYHVSSAVGELNPPEHMTRWIERYFGSVEQVRRQKVVKITNQATMEGALFNEVRAQRPLEARIPEELLTELARNAPDPFCEPLLNTPEDVFGRIEGRCCVTASNIAKYDGWHGVIIFNEHDPLGFDEEAVADFLDVARRWWQRAHAADPAAIYPLFMWNCLWKAGASIPHGHAQISLARGMHYAKIEQLRRAAEMHRTVFDRNYFEELYAVHRDLGLAAERDGVRLLAHLTPIKEKELVLLADRCDTTLAQALYQAVQCLISELGVTSFNVVLYHAPLDPAADHGGWQNFPIVVRLVDRGDPTNRTADFGAMELYAASVISSDPFGVARKVLNRFQDNANYAAAD
ncbi:MAG: hypothetical protein ACTHMJ_15255 [Thermomicrobiales bacterium]